MLYWRTFIFYLSKPCRHILSCYWYDNDVTFVKMKHMLKIDCQYRIFFSIILEPSCKWFDRYEYKAVQFMCYEAWMLKLIEHWLQGNQRDICWLLVGVYLSAQRDFLREILFFLSGKIYLVLEFRRIFNHNFWANFCWLLLGMKNSNFF